MPETRFTFAVCIACGVQSPPIILSDAGPPELAQPLADMGWKFDRLRFNILATCPGCRKEKEHAA